MEIFDGCYGCLILNGYSILHPLRSLWSWQHWLWKAQNGSTPHIWPPADSWLQISNKNSYLSNMLLCCSFTILVSRFEPENYSMAWTRSTNCKVSERRDVSANCQWDKWDRDQWDRLDKGANEIDVERSLEIWLTQYSESDVTHRYPLLSSYSQVSIVIKVKRLGEVGAKTSQLSRKASSTDRLGWL